MIDKFALIGLLTETFVYNELHRLFKVPYTKCKVKEEEVCFSVYEQYELDFMVIDKKNIIYGIEVKAKDRNPKSLKVFIDKRFVDRGIVAKSRMLDSAKGDKQIQVNKGTFLILKRL